VFDTDRPKRKRGVLYIRLQEQNRLAGLILKQSLVLPSMPLWIIHQATTDSATKTAMTKAVRLRPADRHSSQALIP
jgi:hypothetical protein